MPQKCLKAHLKNLGKKFLKKTILGWTPPCGMGLYNKAFPLWFTWIILARFNANISSASAKTHWTTVRVDAGQLANDKSKRTKTKGMQQCLAKAEGSQGKNADASSIPQRSKVGRLHANWPSSGLFKRPRGGPRPTPPLGGGGVLT